MLVLTVWELQSLLQAPHQTGYQLLPPAEGSTVTGTENMNQDTGILC